MLRILLRSFKIYDLNSFTAVYYSTLYLTCHLDAEQTNLQIVLYLETSATLLTVGDETLYRFSVLEPEICHFVILQS